MKLKFSILFFILLTFSRLSLAQISFPQGSTFPYLKGNDASNLPTDWYTIDYNSSTWQPGTAPFYYGNIIGSTLLSDMQNNYTTVYFRKKFNATKTELIPQVTFSVNYDDGFVIWINGIEIVNRNAPTVRSYNSLAPINHDAGTFEKITISLSDTKIIEGENLIAIQLFNRSLTSSDIYFDLKITGLVQLPVYEDTCSLIVNNPSGFYTNPFILDLKLTDETKTLVYTCDGSNPQSSTTAISVKGNTTILIDPNITVNRAKTPAFTLRVSQVDEGYNPSISKTFTYIFYNNVKTQTDPGGDWPSSRVNDQLIDLEMDSKVINDPRYKNIIDSALLDIPSISIVTDNYHLFDPSTGIYVNAMEHGEEWERECSIELLDNSKKEPGFQANVGLRIRGGLGGRDGYNPKHSFRIFFRSEYGQSKLEYPLFGTEGVDEFDKFDLRTERNYSWSNDGSYHNTFLRDVFSRDASGALNQPYTKSRFYHLYLNGMYWGLYQTEERPEANFGESYLGGDDGDYDVVKVNVGNWPYRDEVTDGTMDNWEQLYDFSIKTKISTDDYFAIQGKDANGKTIHKAKALLDVDNLIDFMLVIFYTDNFDGPVSAWYDNKMPNNFYALYNHYLGNKGFVFVNHDCEHSLFAEETFYGSLNGNRVTLSPKMNKPTLETFQPQWLHQQLCQVPEYQVRFSDRAHEVFGNYGVFSADSCTKRLNMRKDQIDMAIIAESARWGDAKTASALTKDDEWLPEVNTILKNFFPYRTPIVVNQLKTAKLFSDIDEPEFYIGETQIYKVFEMLQPGTSLQINNPSNEGTIYYTINGSDPRLIGGNINTKAINLGTTGTLNIDNSTQINARVLDGNVWGPLSTLSLLNQNENFSNFKITEIHYHPKDGIDENDTIDSKDLEFIEFKNIGNTALNLSGLKVDTAVYYQFPENALLNPGQFYIIASKPNKFSVVQGIAPTDNYSGNLSNSGEQILVLDASGKIVISCDYKVISPWPVNTDGYGYTLSAVAINPTGDPNDYTYWKSSTSRNGSPFKDDAVIPVENEKSLNQIAVFPNPTHGNIKVSMDGNEPSGPVSTSIYDLTGRIINQQEASDIRQLEIDFSQMRISSGMYALALQTGSIKKTFKINFIEKQ